MNTNHIDQLKEWWENAEEGIPSAGDTVIFDERHRGLGFHVTQATMDHPRGYDNARILARAPKPKPAWRDAVAVIASTDFCERQVWERDGASGWDGTAGDTATTEELRDVTPLIEAKVTGEMVEAARQEAKDRTSVYWERSLVSRILTAALGLETR